MKILRWMAFVSVFLIPGLGGGQPAWGAEYPYDDEVSIEEKDPPPEPVAVDVKLPVDSTSPDGVKFEAPEKGTYRIAIAAGAFCYLPKGTEGWQVFGGWSTEIHYYVNHPIQWGADDQWGKHPVNFTDKIGVGERQDTVAKAEAAAQGVSVTVDLDKGGYIWFVVSDGTKYYGDNSGSVTVRVTGP